MSGTLCIQDAWAIYKQIKIRQHSEENVTLQNLSLCAFLHLYWKEVQRRQAVRTMCDMRTLANHLCQEFMSDIIKVTSSTNNEDDEPLQNYLLNDRGWLLLFTIHKNGIQGLTVGKDLCNLLISLLPWCLKFPVDNNEKTVLEENEALPTITSSFCHLEQTKKWKHYSKQQTKEYLPLPDQQNGKTVEKSPKVGRRKYIKMSNEDSKSNSDSDTENIVERVRQIKTGRKLARQKHAGISESLAREPVERSLSSKEEDDQELATLLTKYNTGFQRISAQQLCFLILDVLRDLCVLDIDQSTVSKMLSPTLLPHLLHILTNLYPTTNGENKDLFAFHWLKRDNTHFQRKLLRLIFKLTSLIATQPNGINIIIGHKFVPVVLDVSKQIHQLQTLKEQLYHANKRSADLNQMTDDFVLLAELVLGLLLTLDIVFQSLPFNLVFIKSAIHLIEEFDDGHGFTLLENIILTLDSDNIKAAAIKMKLHVGINEPFKIIGLFLNTLKSLKMNYIHTMKCSKRKHKNCHFSQYFNHHHNILGFPLSSQDKPEHIPDVPLQNTTCLIASWCTFLLDLLPKVKTKSSQIEILRTAELYGNCCCTPMEVIFEPIKKSIHHFINGIQHYTLEVLNRMILEFLDGKNDADEKEKSITRECNTCKEMRKVVLNKKNSGEEHVARGMDSGFSSHDFQEKATSNITLKSSLLIMQGFKDLLFHQKGSVSEVTAKQLCTLAVSGSEKLKEALFFNVYVHAFESFLTEAKSASQNGDTVKFSSKVKVHCLLAIPHLLKVDSIMQTFLTKNGVGQICSMLDDDALRAPVLKVFEALVLLDEEKEREFENSLESDDDKLKGGMVISAFINGLAKKTDTSLSDHLSSETLCQERPKSEDKYIQNLTVMVDMWETCAKICLNSDRFVAHMLKSQCLPIAGNILLRVLKQLRTSVNCDIKQDSSEDSGQELDHLVSLTMKIPSVCFLKLDLLNCLLTVCNTCYKHYGRQNEIKMWTRIKEAFHECSVLPSAKLKTLFDILLSSAMPRKTTVFDTSLKTSILQDFIKDDEIEDDEIRQLLHMSSEDETDCVRLVEQGYDGDTEASQDDHKSCRGLDLATRREYFASVFRLLIELLIHCQKCEAGREILPQTLLKLLQTLKGNCVAVMVVSEEGLLNEILSGFWSQLTNDDENVTVRNYMLSLIQLLAQYRVTAQEFQKILQLFQYSHIPQDLLLSTLLSIVEQSNIQPYYCIKFPIKYCSRKSSPPSSISSSNSIKISTDPPQSGNAVVPLLRSISSLVTSVPIPDNQGPHEITISVQQKYFEQEVWKLNAVEIPLTVGFSWPPYKIGFTVSTWLKICEGEGQIKKTNPVSSANHVYASSSEDLTQKDGLGKCFTPMMTSECVHVMSVGNREKLLETWICCQTGNIHFRLTSEFNKDGLIIGEAVSRDPIQPGKWHHLLISYVEVLENRENNNIITSCMVGKVVLVLDGWQRQELILEHLISSTEEDTNERRPTLCIGQVYEEKREMSNYMPWQLGHLTLFKGVDVTEEECLHLYALGPSCQSICKCDCPENPITYTTFLTKQLIQHSHIPHDILVGLKLVDVDHLRMKMMLTYSGAYPEQYLLSESALRSEIPALMAGNLGIPQPVSLLLSQQPMVTKALTHGKINTQLCYGLEKAIAESGGMETIMFLVAKIVEENCLDNDRKDKEMEILQSKALQLLFSIVNFSPSLSNDFFESNGNKLLSKVLTSSRGIVGYTTLKALFDASTSESIFRFEPDTGNLVMRRKTEAVVRSSTLIVELILNWRIWEGTEEGVLDLLFRGLASLIREDHPNQAFNIKQFRSASLVNRIFCAYQERIQDGLPAFPVSVSQSVVSIVRGMMGDPADLNMIVSICDFLLFVHPAANTYINCTQAGFFFKLWWDAEVSKSLRPTQTALNKIRKSATSTPHKKQSDNSSESENNVSEKDPSKRQLYFENKIDTEKKYPIVEIVQPPSGDQSEVFKSEVIPTQTDGNISESSSQLLQSKIMKIPNDTSEKKTDETDNDIQGKPEEDNKKVKQSEQVETVSDLEDSTGSGDSKAKKSSKSPSMSDGEKESFSHLSYEGTEISVSSYNSDELSHDDEGLIAPRSDVHFDDRSEEDEFERGLIAVCIGLLQTLNDIVITMPDTMTTKVFQNAINPDILIIIAHSSSPEVRTCVIKLLSSYLFRASTEQIAEFLRKESFHLLGAQFYQYPSHTEQMEEVISLILGRPFSFENNLELEGCEEASALQQSALVLLLSLLENTVWDVALCHNTLVVTKQIFEGVPILGSLLLEAGLVEVICNMLARFDRVSSRSTDKEGREEHQICLEDIQGFICSIASREFNASGNHHLQQFEEVLCLLRHLENTEKSTSDNISGVLAKQIENIKAVQFSVILYQLHIFQMAAGHEPHRQFSLPGELVETYGPRPFSPSFAFRPKQNSSLHQYFPLTKTAPDKTKAEFSAASTSNFTLDSGEEGCENRTNSPGGDSDNSSRSGSLRLSPQTITRSVSMEQLHTKPVKTGFSLSSVFNKINITSKRSRLMVLPISQSELIDRFKKLLVSAVDIVIYSDKREVKPSPEKRKVNLLFEKSDPISIETLYTRQLFEFLYRALELTLHNQQDRIFSKAQKTQIMWNVRDSTRVQLGRLMVHMFSTRQIIEDRTYLLSYIVNEVRGRDVLKMIINTNSDQGHELAYFTWDLLYNWGDWINSQHQEDASKIIQILRNCDIKAVSPRKMDKEQESYLQEEKKSIDLRMSKGRHMWKKIRGSFTEKVLHKHDKMYTQLSSLAMDMTQRVTQLQRQERNKFIEHIKRTMTEKIQVKKSWQQIVQNLTHERAVWHDARSYPKSWQLDPTEGPGRVRKRLKRCHLGIEPRFLMKEDQFKLDNEKVDPPLIYLFEDDHQMSDSAALIYQLYRNEKIQHTCKCTAVSPFNESKGELLVGENSIFFVADEAISDANYTQVLLGNKDQLSMTWPFQDIKEIHKRWFQLRDIGIEIFLTNGKTCLLACQHKQEREGLYSHLMELELSNYMTLEDLDIIQRSWIEGRITNFDYLTHLNKVAGRSFNDLMQYPIFPFVLKDYFSNQLDLSNEDSYRNLSKPMSVQCKSKEQKYIDNYMMLKQENERHGGNDVSLLRVAPYHYGSHYSNSGVVLHFLVRLPPFTKMFLSYQDKNFDLPDRTFHSVQTAWRLASFESATDVKELIPEFFFLPEFLQNIEGFDFGLRQNGERVDDVNLPPWCNNDPRLFVMILRQALESAYVTRNLHNWIDLVFGYKQQGDAAIKAINVFHPSTYFGMDIDSIKDPLRRHALRTMVRTYGQTPKQLFRIPHPQRTFQQDTPSIISQIFLSASHNAVQSAPQPNVYSPSPLCTVNGLKWGVYVGSRDLSPPEVVWQRRYDAVVANLLPLPTGEVFGVGESSCCLTMHSKQKVSTLSNATDVIWAAILDWKQPDGVLRIRNGQKEKPPVNLLTHNSFEQITCCASVTDCRLLFVGGTSGTLTVYQTVFNQAKESHLQIKGKKLVLHSHTGKINTLVICKPYSIVVTGSEDNTCIIWDLNRLCFVRAMSDHKSAVKVVAVSPTLGDIASVSDKGPGSILLLHSINAAPIATSINHETTIKCLSFSTAPEGQSVNILAGGLDNGTIRLWSTMDLTVLRDLQTENLMHKPVISLTFTHDSTRLYMSSSDGTITVWESPPLGRMRPNNLILHI